MNISSCLSCLAQIFNYETSYLAENPNNNVISGWGALKSMCASSKFKYSHSHHHVQQPGVARAQAGAAAGCQG